MRVLVVINRYDVAVLDRDLPRMHGDEVCRRLVATHSPVRVLMLTASGELEHRIDGLSIGADDYLAKPLAFETEDRFGFPRRSSGSWSRC